MAAVSVDQEGKHPLEHGWEIWYDSRKMHAAGGQDWLANLQKVALFNTVEDFWNTYNFIKRPSDLEFGSNYHMFKQGVKPMWEDDANRKGGKWVISISKEDAARLDDVWELLLLAMIGEYLDDGVSGDQICGAVLSCRKAGPRISVWTKDRDAHAVLKQIGSRLWSILKLNEKTQLEYQNHEDAMVSGSSFQNEARMTC